jgi:hypothetical protein
MPSTYTQAEVAGMLGIKVASLRRRCRRRGVIPEYIVNGGVLCPVFTPEQLEVLKKGLKPGVRPHIQ